MESDAANHAALYVRFTVSRAFSSLVAQEDLKRKKKTDFQVPSIAD